MSEEFTLGQACLPNDTIRPFATIVGFAVTAVVFMTVYSALISNVWDNFNV